MVLYKCLYLKKCKAFYNTVKYVLYFLQFALLLEFIGTKHLSFVKNGLKSR